MVFYLFAVNLLYRFAFSNPEMNSSYTHNLAAMYSAFFGIMGHYSGDFDCVRRVCVCVCVMGSVGKMLATKHDDLMS